MYASQPMTRRTLLRGAGVALSLPLLESIATRAHAKPVTSPRRIVCVGNHLGFWPGGFFPSQAGTDYQTSLTLGPIDAHRDNFTIFSNLDSQTNGGHKGVRSALIAFQTNEFRRVKIGVAPAEQPDSITDYLLTPFAAEAAAVIDPAIKAAVDQLLSMLCDA